MLVEILWAIYAVSFLTVNGLLGITLYEDRNMEAYIRFTWREAFIVFSGSLIPIVNCFVVLAIAYVALKGRFSGPLYKFKRWLNTPVVKTPKK